MAGSGFGPEDKRKTEHLVEMQLGPEHFEAKHLVEKTKAKIFVEGKGAELFVASVLVDAIALAIAHCLMWQGG